MSPETAALLAAAIGVVAWNIGLAGRIAQRPRVSRGFRAVSGLAGFLVAPALVLGAAAAWPPTAAPLAGAAWVWPAVAWLFVVQVGGALGRRLVTPWVAVPILAWDAAIAAEATVRWAQDAGYPVPAAASVVAGAWELAAHRVAGDDAWRPWRVAPPALAPAYPAAWPLSRAVRAAVAIAATAGVAAVGSATPEAWTFRHAVAALGDAPPVTRDVGEVSLGVRIFPTVAGAPPRWGETDLAIASALAARAVHLRVQCDAAGTRALEALARALEEVRRGGVQLVVTCALPRAAVAAYARDPRTYLAARARDAERVVRVLKPELLVPVEAPGGGSALPRTAWPEVVVVPGNVARAIEPRTRVALAVSLASPDDSALYAWAARPLAPVQAVLLEVPVAGPSLAAWDVVVARADAWQRAHPAPREHWIGGLAAPARGLGEQAQARWLAHAVRAAAQRGFAGVLLDDVADYDAATGIRTPAGRPRAAVATLRRLLADVPPAAAP